MELLDSYNRKLTYLRISVTDRCNLRCIYCKPDGKIPELKHDDILTYEEFFRLSNIAMDLGVNKIRLTGGEPLARLGLAEFAQKLADTGKLKDIGITTNAVFLKKYLPDFKRNPIVRFNISLDTLNREKYKLLTGADKFEEVWDAIETAVNMGFQPIKINMVAMKGMNDDEVADMARLTIERPIALRYIEYMPMNSEGNKLANLHTFYADDIKAKLESELGALEPIGRANADGPAVRYRIKGALGEVGFINPMSHRFCGECNRMRLTSTGGLRPCLLSDTRIDIRTPLRNGASDSELAAIFLKAAGLKNAEHHLAKTEEDGDSMLHMGSIGG